MAKVEIKREGFKCERCGHSWIPHNIKDKPKYCPKCKSHLWNKPRKNKPKIKQEGNHGNT